jgi:hypothetical protein
VKAIRVYEFGDPEVMRFEEVVEPQVGPGQVLTNKLPHSTLFARGEAAPDVISIQMIVSYATRLPPG